jgi:putative colanic acid biosynthesis UDP-glucose lipid carrier transferase
MQERVEHDLHTIRNGSLALDIKIVTLTLLRGFVGPGAY